MTDDARYHGPPRNPNDVIAAALADEQFMHQIHQGVEEQRRGIPGVPLRQVREEEARARRSA